MTSRHWFVDVPPPTVMNASDYFFPQRFAQYVFKDSAIGGSAVFIGSEGAGLPRELIPLLDETIVIPHAPQVESLNAGIAASIVLYEAARQRKR